MQYGEKTFGLWKLKDFFADTPTRAIHCYQDRVRTRRSKKLTLNKKPSYVYNVSNSAGEKRISHLHLQA